MRHLLVIAGLAAASLLLTGCTKSHAHDHDHDHEPESAATYKEGHGIRFSAVAMRFAGIATEPFTGRLAAPSLLRTAKGDFVYVVNGEWFLRTPVRLGPDGVSVLEGLYEGDLVVTQGARDLWLAELGAINGGVGCADGH